MNARIAVAAVLTVLASLAGMVSPRSQGFSGLGADPGGFAAVVPGRALSFPGDHGAHPDYRIEWWYFTANLTDASGARYGVQWTLFRQAVMPGAKDEGWATQQLWMGHAAVTSATTHRFAEKFARGGVGQAAVSGAPFEAFIDDWQMKSAVAEPQSLTPLELTASGENFSYRLQLASQRPVVLQGDNGFSIKSERGQASYYYSQPYLDISGSITLDGKVIAVTGQGWIDREWSSQPLASDQTGWDWFSLHLDSGDKLMLFRLRHADGKNFYSGNWIGRDGRSERIEPGAINMLPLVTTRIGEHTVPVAWRIEIPSRALLIETMPLNAKSWMGTRFQYWEGPIAAKGSHTGVGYLEMTGYD